MLVLKINTPWFKPLRSTRSSTRHIAEAMKPLVPTFSASTQTLQLSDCRLAPSDLLATMVARADPRRRYRPEEYSALRLIELRKIWLSSTKRRVIV